jgi:hypothetical protein
MKALYALLLVTSAVLVAAGPVRADEFFLGDAQVVDQFRIGVPDVGSVLADVVEYSNLASFTGGAFSQGASANQAGNQITRLLADDITPTGAHAGQDVSIVVFSVANLNAVAVSARPRLRFWFADGPGGAPGIYYNLPANVGFTFNPLTFAANSVTLVSGAIPAGVFQMPGATFWAGVTFDNNGGATGATAAQMDNLGQGVFDPPTVGSSADALFLTQDAGSFFGVNGPAGSIVRLADLPSNLAWEFSVSVPVPSQVTTLGRLKSSYR